MTEKQVYEKLGKAIAGIKSIWLYKPKDLVHSGIPDLLITYHKRTFAFELKGEGSLDDNEMVRLPHPVSGRQIAALNALSKAGGQTGVIACLENALWLFPMSSIKLGGKGLLLDGAISLGSKQGDIKKALLGYLDRHSEFAVEE